MPKQPDLTRERWSERVVRAARQAGSAGVRAAKLGTAAQRRSPAFAPTLDALLADGTLLEQRKGKSSLYFHRDTPPPTPAEIYAAETLAKLQPVPEALWLESVLTGKGTAAPERRAILQNLASAGRLTRLEVHTSARKSGPAYTLAPSPHPPPAPPSPTPAWPEIESVARALARDRFDAAPSFEDVARHLDTTPLVIQTAVLQAVTTGAPIQLVPGESREATDPATAALVWDDRRFYRFTFPS
jgi:hypothetical protein